VGAGRPTFVLCKGCAMKLTEKWVQEVIDQHVENVELVALEDVGNRRHRVVRLFIDHPTGVSHDLCAQVSGLMGTALDESESMDGSYTLEVSSPGLERPLTKPAHFQAQLGRKVTVLTRAPVEGRSVWRGVLREVRDGEITLADGGDEVVIDLADVTKANLVYEFKQGRGDE
jgi:ribosome maturation factor RimP